MPDVSKTPDKIEKSASGYYQSSIPSISLPKGGGAIRGIGEKFAANPVTGTGSVSVPIATSPGRSGFGPQLSLSYDSGSGNGPFGFGWSLALPCITRKTDKGLPQYRNAEDSDEFILSGAEDLVSVFKKKANGEWELDAYGHHVINEINRDGYRVRRYRPRIEGLFARIERWTHESNPSDVFWRSISKDNITTWYGKTENSRISDPNDKSRIFSWLICQSYNDKGNAIIYEYVPEDSAGIDGSQTHESNRTPDTRKSNRYLKRIKYGNRRPNRDVTNWEATDPTPLPNNTWMFEVVFDYGEGHYIDDPPDAQECTFAQAQIDPPEGSPWPVRQDPFSIYRAGFEVRTYRLCHRVLMFHHFPQELGVNDYLVRSTEFSYAESPIASFITGVTQSGYVRQPADNQPNRYLKKSLPPLEFEYSLVPSPEQLGRQPIREVDAESLENLPVGLDGTSYQWIDLDGEGTSGILTEQADGWYYKRNLSANNLVLEDRHEHTVARFGATEVVARMPAVGLSGGAQFIDLAGDGQVDLVQMEGSVRGFYERTDEASWAPFQPFVSWPKLNTRDPNLKFIDLTGDGHADILITEGEALTWYPSLAEEGFGPAVRVSLPLDEEKGPRLIFADGTQSIYLADFSGDGLSDLVRIRNGEVCYWPNLGYGHFGAKVTMDNAPWFDSPDQFDQRRIRLADTDGSGTTDILYLRGDGVQIYFNQIGNRWSDAVALPQFPPIDNISAMQTLDLLGNGTACLVWSSPLPDNTRRPMRYIALMEGKPHLLIGVKNNLGAETKVHYAPSTKFYLNDKRDGKPWITRLPFPVQVVERVETYDHIGRNRFVTRYAYHHGHFDGVEREFRGFGMVEQWDTEELAALTGDGTLPEATNINPASHVPPVHTKTWFHTGVYLGRDHVSNFFAGIGKGEGEYYREPALRKDDAYDTEAEALLLPDTVLLPGLTLDEEREACRALKGSMLRQEVYALDGTPKAEHPYTVAEQNFTVKCLQPPDGNRHAVFFTHARESINYHYERNPADPRIAHAMTLEVDDFGNVLKEVAIAYGRRKTIHVVNDREETKEISNPGLNKLSSEDQKRQTDILITYTENRVAKDPITYVIDTPDDYRTPLPCETRTYELTGFKLESNATRFSFDEWTRNNFALPTSAVEIHYEQIASHTTLQKRLIEHVRTLYREDDLTALLPLEKLMPMALPGKTYKLAFTPGLLKRVFQRPREGQSPENLIPDPANVLGGKSADQGGYEGSQDLKASGHFPNTDPDEQWWIPSGRVFYSPNSGDTAAGELAYARQHFFLPHRYRDPFGNEAIVTYDNDVTKPSKNHNLLLVETKDPLGNAVTVKTQDDNGNIGICNDYRVLQPYWVTDPNHNRTQVVFDALGLVVAMAVMGKPMENKGDNLIDFEADLAQAQIDTFHDALNPQALAVTLLKGASTRIVYDLHRFHLSKRAHPEDPTQWEPPYAATLARETHASDPLPSQGLKIQVSFSYSDGFGREIQRKIQTEPGPIIDGGPDVNPRWVGSGWTIFNNKGKPVRQYEPFFDDTHQFKFGHKVGVSTILFYDPIERVIATLHPNHTYEKVIFDPWQQTTWDVNDTVNLTPSTDDDVKGFFLDPNGTPRISTKEYLPTWHALRTDPAHATEFAARYPDAGDRLNETDAAMKAAAHADTHTEAYFDALGRLFLTVAHNKVVCPNHPLDGTEDKFHTRVELDIEGNQRVVRDAVVQNGDAQGRIVMHYDYDMLSNRIHQASMEAGERWMLNDVTGKTIRAWDSRGHNFWTEYDKLRRLLNRYVRGTTADSDPRTLNKDILFEKVEYGEGQANDTQLNLRARVFKQYDSAGIVVNMGKEPATGKNEAYDFKGNLLRTTRELVVEYKDIINWTVPPPHGETFTSSTTYDALSRPVTLIRPDNSVIRPGYNEANMLERIEVNLRGAAAATVFVSNIDYSAKGQRTRIEYETEDGNLISTSYDYDRETFRLIHLYTRRGVDPTTRQGVTYTDDCDNPQPPPPTIAAPGKPPQGKSCGLQNLHYTYDPVGNITSIRDDSRPAVFFKGEVVTASNGYVYDAIYRLIAADGREHIGQVEHPETTWDDKFRVNLLHPQDGQAMRRYAEEFIYDEVGNFEQLIHHLGELPKAGQTFGQILWKRAYAYDENSLLESPTKKSNRLSSTTVGRNNPVTEQYDHDSHGNMTKMPHLAVIVWDFKDQMQTVDLGGGGKAYYVYDASGHRVRKVIHRQNGTKQKERIYLGGFEVYREYNGAGDSSPKLGRETLHIMDDKQRIALVETKTIDTSVAPSTLPETLVRYQFGNHLGTACLELDADAKIISYEEYYPYGSTSYQAVRKDREVPLKRYRYTAKERDEESGLYYHGARYYAPWLGRWINTDPHTLKDGTNLYQYVGSNPISRVDSDGLQSDEPPLGKEILNQLVPREQRKEVRQAFKEGHKAVAIFNNKVIEEYPFLSDYPELKKDALEVQKTVIERAQKSGRVAADDLYKQFQQEFSHRLKEQLRAEGLSPVKDLFSLTDEGKIIWKKGEFAGQELVLHHGGVTRAQTRHLPGVDPGNSVDPEGLMPMGLGAHAPQHIDPTETRKVLEGTSRERLDALQRLKPSLPVSSGVKQISTEAGEGFVKRAAKYSGKKVLKAIPIIGALYTLFGPGPASAGERALRTVAGEIQVGPFDLEMAYDFLMQLGEGYSSMYIEREKDREKYGSELDYFWMFHDLP